MEEPKPFKIAVSDALLSFINQRVATARLPPGFDLPENDTWSYGVPPATVSQLREYWEKKYDWRTVEARINGKLKMFTLPITEAGETMTIHFVHHKSDHEGAIPLLFQHGWPGNFLEVEKIIDSLTDPKEPGQQAFHVVAPSLPGFVFSDGPKRDGFWLRNIAAVDHKLMLALGYEKYVAQGGDWGSMIARILGIEYPEHAVAIHVNALVSAAPSWWRYPFHLIYLIIWAMLQPKGKNSNFGMMMWFRNEEVSSQRDTLFRCDNY
jgi:pimeloyl-ACP methyl ester carboxylesterase